VAANITGTSTVVPVVTAASTSFGPVTFEVAAINTANRTSSQSVPSKAVTPYLPPLTPTATVTGYTQNGSGATLTVSCPQTSCWQGNVGSYTVAVNGSSQTVTAAAGGAATQITVSNLAANTSYTAVVTALDPQGKTTGPPGQALLTTMGPPIVTSVAVSAVSVGVGAGAQVGVTAVVNPGGESSCTVSVTLNGAAQSAACGAAIALTFAVPMYHTSYTATVTATNNDGQATGSASGTSSLKELTANASTAFGAGCPNIYGGSGNCGPNSSAFPTDTSLSNPSPVSVNTVVSAECWAAGKGISGADAAYPSGTNYYDWVEITSPYNGEYMSELYFPNPPGVTAGLPNC
jgi:hypothetical protein